MSLRVIVEADGGSRGNPGPAAYGALLRDAGTGAVLAERAERIGVATNNVAEYRGLIAGLELVRHHTPLAQVEVRMDSKLVIEQMAGRWKIKHPDMKPLALEAARLAPSGVTWTWVPRERNAAADELLNAALDGRSPTPDAPTIDRLAVFGEPDPTTTLMLLRDAVTSGSRSGVLRGSGGASPGLTAEGRAQAKRAARWLARRGGVETIVSSPLRSARETADLVAAALELEVGLVEDLAEPVTGESTTDVATRIRTALDGLLAVYAGRTVLVVSHATPIRMLVRVVLDAPLHVVHRMQVAPASLTTLRWGADGVPMLQQLSTVPD